MTTMFYTFASVGRSYQISDYQKKYSTGEYVGTRILTAGTAFILCALYCCLFSGYDRYEILCILVYMGFKVTEAMSDEYQAIQQLSERMDYICFSFILRGVLSIVTFSAVLAVSGELLPALAAMTVSTAAVVIFYDLRICKRLEDYRVQVGIRRSLLLLIENIPMFVNSLFLVICIMIPRTALKANRGNYEMGIYGSVSAPTSIVQSIAIWLFLPFLPQLAKYYNEERKKDFLRLHMGVSGALTASIAVIMIAAALLGKWGLNLIFGEEIAAYDGLLIPTLWTTVLIAAVYYISNVLTAIRKLGAIVAGNIVSLAVTVLFADRIVAMYGMMGVNYAIYIAGGANVLIQAGMLTVYLVKWFMAGKKQPERKDGGAT